MKNKKVIFICLLVTACIIISLLLFLLITKYNNSSDEAQQVNEDKHEVVEETIVVEAEDENEIKNAVQSVLDASDYEGALNCFVNMEENPDTAFFVAQMYLQGLGINQDIDKAIEYLEKAYYLGNKNAGLMYSEFLFLGEGNLKVDYDKAFEVASSIDDSRVERKIMLGCMYALGLGVDYDYNIAYAYFNEAKAEDYCQWILPNVTDEKVALPEINTSSVKFVKLDYGDDELEKLVEKLTQKLMEGEQYGMLYNETNAMLSMDAAFVNNLAIFGKDNWLFWKNMSDGTAYHDYIGDNIYPEEEMAAIADNLLKEKEKLETLNKRFILLIIPNKETVYTEYMPTYIKRVSDISRMDYLVDYLKSNTDLEIIYMRDEFNALKNDYLLYYKSDTHTNMIGTYVCMKELLNKSFNKSLKMEGTVFQEHLYDFCGDIGVLIGRTDKYDADTVYFLAVGDTRDEDRVDNSLLLIGDSFSEFLNVQSGYYFKGGVTHVMILDHDYNYYKALEDTIEDFQGDIVVWELAERFADRLK